MIKKKNHEEVDDADDYVSHTVCGGVNCHYLSGGQFGNIFQMRIPFDLKVALVRIIPKEIIEGEGKEECTKMFVTGQMESSLNTHRWKIG